jgi:DNA-binding GntR family transcriptional regulator
MIDLKETPQGIRRLMMKKTAKPAKTSGVGELDSVNELPFAIQPTVSLPDKVAEVLRETILSGKWGPGDRIVETRIAKQLKVGQPTVREALGKLEEAGMVRRYPNSGCVVTELSEQEVGQMFTVRIELECLAAALAAGSTNPQKRALLTAALQELQQAAIKGSIENYYGADFNFHRTIWRLADNPFLEKVLVQLVIPIFNFAILELKKHSRLDLKEDASAHNRVVKAVVSGDTDQARNTVKSVMSHFRHKSLTFVQERK